MPRKGFSHEIDNCVKKGCVSLFTRIEECENRGLKGVLYDNSTAPKVHTDLTIVEGIRQPSDMLSLTRLSGPADR